MIVNVICFLNIRMEWLNLENNSFLVIWLQNQFIYGFKVFVIDKETLATTYQNIEKPQAGETLDGMIERILVEYNISDFAIKAEAAARAAGASVTSIFTANKKDMGYTVIDTDKAFDASGVEGAIRVRTI